MKFGTSIKKLHDDIDLGVQAIASNDYDRFTNAQKDSFIHRATINWINNTFQIDDSAGRVVSNLNSNLKNYSKINDIIVKNKTLNLYKPATSDAFYEDDMVYAVLPDNLLYLLPSPRVQVSYSSDDCKDTVVDYGQSIERGHYYVKLVEDAGTCNYFKDFAITFTGTIGAAFSGVDFNLNTVYGISSFKENSRDELIRIVLDYYANIDEVEVYWEEYEDVFQPNSFIFVFAERATVAAGDYIVTITRTETTNSGTSAINTTGTQGKHTYSYEDTAVLTADQQAALKWYKGEVVASEILYEKSSNPFGKTTYNKPLVTIADNRLYIYKSSNFNPTKVRIDYIKLPLYPVYRANIMQRFNDAAIEAITQETIAMMKAVLNQSNYQVVRQEDKI